MTNVLYARDDWDAVMEVSDYVSKLSGGKITSFNNNGEYIEIEKLGWGGLQRVTWRKDGEQILEVSDPVNKVEWEEIVR